MGCRFLQVLSASSAICKALDKVKKTEALEKQLKMLGEQYEAANEQLNTNLNQSSRPLIQAQIDGIFEQMQRVERELQQIQPPDGEWDEIPTPIDPY